MDSCCSRWRGYEKVSLFSCYIAPIKVAKNQSKCVRQYVSQSLSTISLKFSLELNYTAKLFNLLPCFQNYSVGTISFVIKYEHLLMVYVMFWCSVTPLSRFYPVKTICKVTKFVYPFWIFFLSVTLNAAEVMLKISDCRMALCDRYSFFLGGALFTASGKSVNSLSLINWPAISVAMQCTWWNLLLPVQQKVLDCKMELPIPCY